MSGINNPSPPSTLPERFVESGDHMVIDTQRKLCWLKQDTYQMTGKWLNWVQSRDYAKELNESKYAGYNNWRLPTLEEAKSLYSKSNQNKDHMGQMAYLHPIFPGGFGFLCWTREVRNKIQAVRFGYRKGGMMYDDVYRVSRGSTRLVRDINST
ncbi:MAG: DUF1566 domain-containing protein [Nitrospinaceae bacterium]|nr:DUF1566 domain-containing protein [Nitrospinaceae bacterium]NIR53730.1 DUF1566 domain-containing protein [Nitrospinaceae bacterium]NIS84138.1 DUF1566 domain-containing protein [Nitrospinaceae bacterium]NIT80939.1 DUF1566 domain-containing protein [Nitrospinaceae bacterium]NIU43237.1 DUF1566 domain-containing protein [Nitrospinaceae bacterium]